MEKKKPCNCRKECPCKQALKFDSFAEFVNNEAMIVGKPSKKDCNSPDFKIWGAACQKPKKSFKESGKHGKIHMALDIEGEPAVVDGKKKKSKDKLKRVFDVDGEPETI